MSQRYWAFLSYSHADEAAAARLHRALESYSLPSAVRKAHGLPRRLVPVFRDVDELEASSGLTARLQAALDESRWLIVLCSRASAKSKYVASEIEYFISKHGASRILCVLLEGEPAESFPPALRALPDEPLAADLRAGADPQLATLKLIAAMAAVGFTELRNREAQRARRQRAWLAGGLLVAAMAGLGYWDLFQRLHVDYYVAYERRYGIWEGQWPLSPTAVAHRVASYRFTRHGRLNPPERVAFVNSIGGCPNASIEISVDAMHDLLDERPQVSEWRSAARYCAATFEYRADGSIASEIFRNALDRPVRTLFYTEPGLAQLTYNGFASASRGGGIRYVRIERDERGYDRELRYLYGDGQPRPNAEGRFGWRFERDADGHKLQEAELDSDGQAAGEVVRYAYGGAFGPVGWATTDTQGRPRYSRLAGEHAVRLSFDEYGNHTRYSYTGIAGGPALLSLPAEEIAFEFDERGYDRGYCMWGPGHRPALLSGFHCMRNHPDDRLQLAALSFVAPDGSPARNSYGTARLEYDYDARGLVTAYRYLGLDGKPTASWRGNASTQIEWDERGNYVRQRFFGVDGQPKRVSSGAEIRMKFDAHDQPIEYRFLDVSGAPVLAGQKLATLAGDDIIGYATLRIERDERGNVVRERFFGVDQAPILTSGGFAGVDYVRDDVGNVAERRYLDTAGNPVVARDGYAVLKARYDRRGFETEQRYLDAAGKPVASKTGYYGFSAVVDDNGRTLEQRFFGANGFDKPRGFDYAGARYRYDTYGNIEETTYLQADGSAIQGRSLAHDARTYDVAGRLLETRYSDGSGAPIASPRTGCARETSTYDAAGLLAVEQCFGPDGKLADRRDLGWALHRIVREDARVVSEEWVSAAGKPVKPKK